MINLAFFLRFFMNRAPGQETVAMLFCWEGNRRFGVTDSVAFPPTSSMDTQWR